MDKMARLLSQKAALESKLDLIEAEAEHLHQLLVKCGFPKGVESLKIAAHEILIEESKKDS
jgi:hypothetical protein